MVAPDINIVLTSNRIRQLETIVKDMTIQAQSPLLHQCATILKTLLSKPYRLNKGEYEFVSRASTLITEIYETWEYMKGIFDLNIKLEDLHQISVEVHCRVQKDEDPAAIRLPSPLRFRRDPDMKTVKRLEEDVMSIAKNYPLIDNQREQLLAIKANLQEKRNRENAQQLELEEKERELREKEKAFEELCKRAEEENREQQRQLQEMQDQALAQRLARETEIQEAMEKVKIEDKEREREQENKRKEDAERRKRAEERREQEERKLREKLKKQKEEERKLEEEIRRHKAATEAKQRKIERAKAELDAMKAHDHDLWLKRGCKFEPESDEENRIHISNERINIERHVEQRPSRPKGRPPPRRQRSKSVDFSDYNEHSYPPVGRNKNPFLNVKTSSRVHQAFTDDYLQDPRYVRSLARHDYLPPTFDPRNYHSRNDSRNATTITITNSYNNETVNVHGGPHRRRY